MTNKYFEINGNGLNIRCKLYSDSPASIRRIILFLTGFAGHKDTKNAEKLAEKTVSKHRDAALITFNWPCHGDDVRKKLFLTDCDAYLEAVIAYINTRYKPEKLFACCVSFGGYMVLKRVHEKGNPFSKIVLRAPAVNMYDSLTHAIVKPDELEALERGKDVQVGFDRKINIGRAFLDELKACDVQSFDYTPFMDDILIVHGTKDEIIPFEIARAFADNNLIELAVVENADHRFQDPLKTDEACKRTMEFFGF